MPEPTGWDDVSGPATDDDVQRMAEMVRNRMADADVGPLLLLIEELDRVVVAARNYVAAADAESGQAVALGELRKALGGES